MFATTTLNSAKNVEVPRSTSALCPDHRHNAAAIEGASVGFRAVNIDFGGRCDMSTPNRLSAIPTHVEDTAAALSAVARHHVLEAVKEALKHGKSTGNKVLDGMLNARAVAPPTQINIVFQASKDAQLRDIAVKEAVKRPGSLLLLSHEETPHSVRYGFEWRWREHAPSIDKRSAVTPTGSMYAVPLNAWAEASHITGRHVRVFVVAHGAQRSEKDGFIRREIKGYNAHEMAAYLDREIFSLFRFDDDIFAVNFISCALLGYAERPGEPESYVGQFCRALHSRIRTARTTLDISASPYKLTYRPSSFTKFRQVSSFDPTDLAAPEALHGLKLPNKMRWQWTSNTRAPAIEWDWAVVDARAPVLPVDATHTIDPTVSTVQNATVPVIPLPRTDPQSPLRSMHLDYDERHRLNRDHYRFAALRRQFFEPLAHGIDDSNATLLIKFSQAMRSPHIAGTALFALYELAVESDAGTAADLLASIVASAIGPTIFPEASHTDRTHYLASTGRLARHESRWVSGTHLNGAYRIRYVATEDQLINDVVSLARLAALSAASDCTVVGFEQFAEPHEIKLWPGNGVEGIARNRHMTH
ncbi:hypothetical protein [Robbsia andropogonis]|nr:hypothetical protein [Robbsia andropogonis]